MIIHVELLDWQFGKPFPTTPQWRGLSSELADMDLELVPWNLVDWPFINSIDVVRPLNTYQLILRHRQWQ